MSSLRLRTALGVGFLVPLGAAWAFHPQNQATDVQVEAHAIAGTVSWIEGQGGNIGVCAGPDGLLMIDDQFDRLAPKIQAALDSIAKAPLKFLLNTHFHGDHTGGNKVFGRTATIIAHDNVRIRLEKPQTRNGATTTEPKEALPVVTFPNTIRLFFNGEDIDVVHVPSAHTDGDSVVFFRTSNVAHLGDLFFAGRFPFVDLDSGGSLKGLCAALNDLLPKLPADIKIIPGHGPLSTRADLERYVEMLEDCQSLVAAALAAGKSADDMKQAKLLEKYDSWSWQFVGANAFIDVLVRDAK
jgi:glyoxylase-like metal-dependent hydrolase (beta-lactamase superfamily II)